MTKYYKQLLSLAMLLPLMAGMAAAETQSLEVESVEDGDTIIALLNGKPERLQLTGIDAPEDTRNAKLQRDIKVTGLSEGVLLPLGQEATRHLRTLVKQGDTLRFSGQFDQRDRYGRILVVAVDTAGRSLNEQMVKDGYAVMTRYGKIEVDLKTRLEELESEAVASRRGLWGEARETAMIWSGRKQ